MRGFSPVFSWCKWIATLVAILNIAACGMLPGKTLREPVKDFTLNAGLPLGASPVESTAPDSCLSVQVMLPRSAAGFNTSRMAYTEQQDVLNYFSYSQWVDTPAYMLQPLLLKAMERSGVFRDVVKSPSPVGTRFRLVSDDLALVQQVTNETNRVRLAIRVQLLDVRHGDLLLNKVFVLERDAAAEPAAGVAAANDLAGELVRDLAAEIRSSVDSAALCAGVES